VRFNATKIKSLRYIKGKGKGESKGTGKCKCKCKLKGKCKGEVYYITGHEDPKM